MNERRDYIHPQPLDPLGSLIYYLCVTEAIEEGGLIVPSSQQIANRLKTTAGGGGKTRAINARVQNLWEDLFWVNQQHLLFNEHPHPPAEFFRSLAQHNVNRRMQQFQPGFEAITRRTRRLTTTAIVDKTGTALRLVALKDLYHLHRREVPKQLLLDFAAAEGLVADANEFYSFVQGMYNIAYLDVYPVVEGAPLIAPDRHFYLEPTDTFRSLDLYVELRALDSFTEKGAQGNERREQRIALHAKIKDFVASHR